MNIETLIVIKKFFYFSILSILILFYTYKFFIYFFNRKPKQYQNHKLVDIDNYKNDITRNDIQKILIILILL